MTLRGSGSDDDGRREVRGLDGVVAADVQRSEAAALSLPLSPQHTECGERGTCTMASFVRWWRGTRTTSTGLVGAEGYPMCFVAATGCEIRPGRRHTLTSGPIFGSGHNNLRR
ncbi:uncharacterized protein LOC119340043 [Triticum dicoccoides]|uniref:uncharacterized protein LOC119340043 n=1 Tax=Triticum dicoccoides TaxID=85692 RepID=UPI00189132C1|nr:uncharacterized protein LOC119340043 [Triticum dicoccoides]